MLDEQNKYRESSRFISLTSTIPFSLLHSILNVLPIYDTLRGIHVLFPVTEL